MLVPLFTYPIADTSWLVVVAKGASHFYFDTSTGRSVWQLSDTCIEDFKNRVNFDDLAVLFARANGFGATGPKRPRSADVKPKTTGLRSGGSQDADVSPQKKPKLEAEPEPLRLPTSFGADPQNDGLNALDSAAEDAEQAQVPQVDDAEHNQTGELRESSCQDEKAPPSGLDLGYSSSEEDGSDESHDVGGGESDTEDSEVNAGLDLGFDSDNEGDHAEDEKAKQEFEALLENHKTEFSLYEPWFVVEEELLPKFSQEPAFYSLSDSSAREKVFNGWVAAQLEGQRHDEQPARAVYPTPKLVLLRFLQEHKGDVRKLYYQEFHKLHTQELTAVLQQVPQVDAESVYRELRVTLNDHAEYERNQKKSGAVVGNLKVARVESFLQKSMSARSGTVATKSVGNAFDRWMQLCNEESIPLHVVESATNFILGDEKRLDAYVRTLNSVPGRKEKNGHT